MLIDGTNRGGLDSIEPSPRQAIKCRCRGAAGTALAGLLLVASARAQTVDTHKTDQTEEMERTEPQFPAARPAMDSGPETPDSRPATPPGAIASELRRYVADGRSILLAPIDWDAHSWAKAAAVVGSVALLSTQDGRIDRAVARNDSSTARSVSRAVTPFGSYAAVGISVASLGGGLIFKDANLRDTGRDAIEAELFAAGIVTPILKATLGRSRPSQGADGDELRPFGGSQSFPSGHATEAFAVASVFAARSEGWVVPTIAYTLASAVGLARMHDREHFASDVVAGAVIGTVIGQSVVRKHPAEGRTAWMLVPFATPHGAGIGLSLAPAPPRRPPEVLVPAVVLATRSGLSQ